MDSRTQTKLDRPHPLTGTVMTGADIMIQVLADEGVKTIFGYSGGAILPTYDAVFRYNQTHAENGVEPMPLIVPANEQGAGFMASGYARATGQVGVAIVTDEGNYGNPINRDAKGPWQDFKELLAEPYIKGREMTSAVVDFEDGPRALGVTELKPKSGFYDFDAKYTDGLAKHVIPAEIGPEATQAALDAALAAHRALGCRGVSRSDFRYDDTQATSGAMGDMYWLEVNTQPGMTALSLVPEQAAHLGISFPEICAWMVENAACDS